MDPDRRAAEFYRLVEGRYAPVVPDAEGWVRSEVLPGFGVRVAWLWDRPKLRDALRELGFA